MENIRTTSLFCQVHVRHVPHNHVNYFYHIVPLQYGGEDVADNTIISCATGYLNMDVLFKIWIDGKGKPDRHVLRHFTKGERQYVQVGYERLIAQHRKS